MGFRGKLMCNAHKIDPKLDILCSFWGKLMCNAHKIYPN